MSWTKREQLMDCLVNASLADSLRDMVHAEMHDQVKDQVFTHAEDGNGED